MTLPQKRISMLYEMSFSRDIACGMRTVGYPIVNVGNGLVINNKTMMRSAVTSILAIVLGVSVLVDIMVFWQVVVLTWEVDVW